MYCIVLCPVVLANNGSDILVYFIAIFTLNLWYGGLEKFNYNLLHCDFRERCGKYHTYMFNASLSEYGHKHNKNISKRKGGAVSMIPIICHGM